MSARDVASARTSRLNVEANSMLDNRCDVSFLFFKNERLLLCLFSKAALQLLELHIPKFYFLMADNDANLPLLL